MICELFVMENRSLTFLFRISRGYSVAEFSVMPTVHSYVEPTILPSARKGQTSGGILMWNKTHYQVSKSSSVKIPGLCSIRCRKTNGCTVYLDTGTVSKGSCIVMDGTFKKWIKTPIPCACINRTDQMTRYGKDVIDIVESRTKIKKTYL